MSLIDHYLANYGYLTVGVGVGAESLGLPLPGESILVAAATYAGASHRLAPATVVAVAAVAAIVGDNLGYLIGRTIGPRMIGALGRRLGDRSRHLRTTQDAFDRHGPWVVVIGRFVSVVRTYTAFLAGVQSMAWRRFLVLNALGGILWASTVGFGASALGAQFGQAASYVLTVGVAGAVIVALAVRRHRSHTPPLASAPPVPDTPPIAGAPLPVADVDDGVEPGDLQHLGHVGVGSAKGH